MGRHADSLESLAIAVQQARPDSPERQQQLTRLIIAMQNSGKIWRGGGSIDAEGHEEALQLTWLWFCKNINRYDSEKAGVMTWFNNYLRFRIKDYNIDQWNEASQRVTPRDSLTDSGEPDNFIERIPDSGDIPPILEEVRQWLAQEPSLLKIHLRKRPDVNCQVLLQRRLPPETPWKELSQEFQVKIPTLSNFYQQKCFPLLLAFGRDRGYL